MPITGELTFPDVPGRISEHNQSPTAHSVRIDNTLTQSGMAADAKATRDLIENVSGQIDEEIDDLDEQVTDLKSALNAIYPKVAKNTGEDIELNFTKDTAGAFIKEWDVQLLPNIEYTMKLETPNQYAGLFALYVNGSSTAQQYISNQNNSITFSDAVYHLKLYCGDALATTTGDYCLEFTFAGDISVIEGNVSTLQGNVSTLQGNVTTISDQLAQTKGKTDEIIIDESANLLDPSKWVSEAYITGLGVVTASDSASYIFIALNGAGNYRISCDKSLFGANVIYLPAYTSDNTEAYSARITGTIIDDTTQGYTIVGFTITSEMIGSGIKYIALSKKITNLTDSMCVKGETYPAEYIEYHYYVEIPNLKIDDDDLIWYRKDNLYAKKAVFDGDSICYASGTSTEHVGRGWAGRIGDPNNMDYYNFGSGGATIVTGTYFDGGSARHWISTSIDTIHASHPDLDYFIFEGGTNDADLLGDSRSSANFGTLDMTDFSGTYDTTKFTGAMDYLCYKALMYYPKAKIGYIVAQKMGTGFSGYDETNNNRYRYFVRAMEVCKKWGIPIINIWDEGQLNPKLISYYKGTVQTQADALVEGYAYYDGQHLTNIGYDIITPKIEAWMQTL